MRPTRRSSSLSTLRQGAAASVLCGLGLIGCADTVPTDDGVHARPEIGQIQTTLGTCTATLVRSNVLLTAARCVQQAETDEGVGLFRIDRPGGESHTYTWDTARVFTREFGADLALLRLSAPVDPAVAIPTTIAMTEPPLGSALQLIGYGCRAPGSPGQVAGQAAERVGQKQVVELIAGNVTAPLCPGDDGGPVVVGADGPVYLINSGYDVITGADTFARPMQYRPQIDAVIAEWAGGGEAAPDAPPPADGDVCAQEGWYGDGVCDGDCPMPDPDCAGVPGDPGGPDAPDKPPENTGDICDQQGWYADGTCDEDCPRPDPDCAGGPAPDPAPQPDGSGDVCAQEGWYGDGVCDQDCAMPDPDCNGQQPPDQSPDQSPDQPPAPDGGDICQQEGWYGDGVCDQDCAMPDPDCNGQQPPEQSPPQSGGDFCQEEGWYGDGVCDQDCPMPDPDCNGGQSPQPGGGDFCQEEGWYGDGVCDVDCPMPDPDCG